METLQTEKKEAFKIYHSTSAEGKALMINLFGEKVFSQKITDRIKTFEDACEFVGDNPYDPRFTTGDPDDIAYQKLKVIILALNEKWIPNWNNSSQHKWTPWFYMNYPGFRFYGSDGWCTFADSSGGSRLVLRSEELANYAGKQFLEIYKSFLS